MKKLYALCFSLLFTLAGTAQIIITEISYNPPESGVDSMEFIELYNAGATMVDLNGYSMGGVDYDFTTEMMMPDSYLVLAENADAMMTVLGVTALQWDGALSNGGEALSIIDAGSTVIDMVEYSPDAPWPTSADGTSGEGATIELCDVTADNSLAGNWRAATNDTGVMLNGKSFLGTPGAANSADCTLTPDHTVTLSGISFSPADITINIGEVIRWDNQGGVHNVNGSMTSYPDNPEGFFSGMAAGPPWTFDHKFSIVGHYDYHCDPHLGVNMVGTVTVVDPNAPTYPMYDIGTVTTADGNTNGVVDSLGRDCTLEGTVHSINFRPGGLTFALIDDNNDGINVFDFDDNYGYTVMMGDRISVKGQIAQFRGLAQIEPVQIDVIGTNTLFDPTIVTDLDESTETQLVQIEGVDYKDGADWKGDGSSYNVVVLLDGNELTLRIDEDTNLAAEEAPFCSEGGLGFRGIGGQFDSDNAAPFDDGYQLLPRSMDDVLCITDVKDLSLEGSIKIAPNPIRNDLRVTTQVEIERVDIYDLGGRQLMSIPYRADMDVSILKTGLYNIQFIKGNSIFTSRFAKM